MIRVLSVEAGRDLTVYSRWLWRSGVAHRIAEESGQQVLWVADQRAVEFARRALEAFENGELEGLEEPPETSLAIESQGLFELLIKHPLTLALIALMSALALLSRFGEDPAWVHWFSFSDFEVVAGYPYFVPLQQSLEAGQWWRLLTPILLHFSALHLVFNMLWLLILGGRIEQARGGWLLLFLVVVVGLVSNVAQYLFSMDHPLFGGFSGVVYGLLGFCWFYSHFCPQAGLAQPRAVIGFMVGWLLLCFTGFVEMVGFGAIANAAHTAGLVSGCGLGAVLGYLHRQRINEESR
ncbi:rhomboid family intramembrane serine protease [Aestuariirhabdus litorea]|nr:rhomboid family intramembrane serine protease [Aestuariirhabdus litorea]